MSHPKKIFGSLNSFLLPRESNEVFGLNQANTGFMNALFQRDYFDEYHFFFDDHAVARAFQKTIRSTLAPPIFQKVRYIDRIELPKLLASTLYWAFHKSDPFIAPLLALRNYYAPRHFPITGVTHTISTPALYHHFVETALSPRHPWDAIVCTSRSAQKAISKIFDTMATSPTVNPPSNFPVIPLGVDTEKFTPRDTIEARKSLALPLDIPVVLSLSRLCPNSKMDLIPLLHVIFELKQGGILPPCQFVLAGSSHGQDSLDVILEAIEALELADTVAVRTDIDEKTKSLLYNAADIFVSLSDNVQETFGLTILEAKASGVPVIASEWNGYRDLVRHGDDGYLVPTYWSNHLAHYSHLCGVSSQSRFLIPQGTVVDMSLFSKYLCELLTTPRKRLEMGRSARDHAGHIFAWPLIIDQYLALWESLNETAEGTAITPQPIAVAPDPFETFSHYPTHLLPDTARFELSPYGRHLKETNATLNAYQEISSLLNIDLIQIILEKDSIEFETILKKFDGQEPIVAFHMMWLFKNHIIQLK